jgi:hypothetical protein
MVLQKLSMLNWLTSQVLAERTLASPIDDMNTLATSHGVVAHRLAVALIHVGPLPVCEAKITSLSALHALHASASNPAGFFLEPASWAAVRLPTLGSGPGLGAATDDAHNGHPAPTDSAPS